MSDPIFITIKTPDGIHTHIECAYGDYDSLCGTDGDDPTLGHFVQNPPLKLVDCVACISMWEMARSVPPRFIKFD